MTTMTRSTGSLANRLTIAIPTRNRPRLLANVLRYYRASADPPVVLIGDSSDPADAAAVAEAVRQSADVLPVTYVRYTADVGIYAAITDLLERVSTPYCALEADDDFLVANSLPSAVAFLESHAEYAVAHGPAVLVSVPRGHGDAVVTAPYPQRTNDLASACDRLTRHLLFHSSITFSVQRTAQMVAHYQLATAARFDTKFAEIFTGCLSIIAGKSKRCDRLYMVRQAHPGQDSVSVSGRLDVFDWLAHRDWARQYAEFQHHLSAALVRVDGVSEEIARRVVKHAFWGYLNVVLPLKFPSRTAPVRSPRARLRLRTALAQRPLARAALLRLRRLLPIGPEHMAIWALRRSDSPYYADFADVAPYLDVPGVMP